MQREAFSQLTTKDVDILTTMLDRSSGEVALIRLLRDKLNFATIYFPDDIPADVVTLNSRVFYSVNGQQSGPRIVVQSEGDDLPAFALSIHTMHGLGLLGLAVGEVTTIEYANGRHETIAVDELVFQPEAERRRRDHRHLDQDAARPTLYDPAPQIDRSEVLSFRPKNRHPVEVESDPDGDDPGPQAA